MKKMLIAFGASALLASPAAAQSTDTQVVTLNGTVPSICTLVGQAAVTLDFDQLADTATDQSQAKRADFGIVCNSADGFTVTLEPQNGALLRNGTETGDGNEIDYKINFLTGGGNQFGPGQAGSTNAPNNPPAPADSGTLTYIYAGTEAARQGRAANTQFAVNGVKGADFNGQATTTVFAGTYTDVVTIAINAN